MSQSEQNNSTPVAFEEENQQAEQFISSGDLPAAARILVSIVEKDPQNARAFNNMGIISWMQKAWHDAYYSFARAVELRPDFSDALVNLFDAALKLRKIDEVTPLFEKAAQLAPESEEINVIHESIKEQGEEIYLSERGLIIGTYNPKIEEADKLVEDGQLYKAMQLYLEVNDTEGASAEAFGGLGVVSYYQKRYKDAFTLFIESIKINPLNADMYLNLIDAAREAGLATEAVQIFKAYLQEFPALEKLQPEFEKLQSSSE